MYERPKFVWRLVVAGNVSTRLFSYDSQLIPLGLLENLNAHLSKLDQIGLFEMWWNRQVQEWIWYNGKMWVMSRSWYDFGKGISWTRCRRRRILREKAGKRWQRKKQRKNQGDYKKEKKRVGNNNELRNTSVNNKKRKREKSPRNIRKKRKNKVYNVK